MKKGHVSNESGNLIKDTHEELLVFTVGVITMVLKNSSKSSQTTS
jgi:hypothetical protein